MSFVKLKSTWKSKNKLQNLLSKNNVASNLKNDSQSLVFDRKQSITNAQDWCN